MRSRPAILVTLAACGLACERGRPEPGLTSTDHVAPSAPSAPTAPAPSASAVGPVLHRVATATEPVSVYDVAGAPLVGSGAFLARVAVDGLTQDPQLLLGLEGDVDILSAAGVFPDAAWLSVVVYSRSTGQPAGKRTYRWRANRWSAAATPLDATVLLGVAELGAERALALFVGDDGALRVAVVRAMSHLDVPALPPGDGASCPRVIRPDGARVIAGGDGAVIVLGARCDAGRAPLALSWKTGASEWTVAALPSRAGATPVIAAATTRGAETWLGGASSGDAYLARREGGAFTLVDAPLHAPLTAVAVAPDGAIWIASAGAVARRGRHGDWTSATTSGPALDGVTSLAVDAQGTAWVGAGAPAPALWSTKPRASVLVVPDKRSMWAARSLTGRAIATDACVALWVPLSVIGKTGGFVPRDLPWLREGARGHAEIASASFVLEDDGVSLSLGAVVPSIEVGEKVLALFGDRLGIAGAKVACHAPHVIRRYELEAPK